MRRYLLRDKDSGELVGMVEVLGNTNVSLLKNIISETMEKNKNEGEFVDVLFEDMLPEDCKVTWFNCDPTITGTLDW